MYFIIFYVIMICDNLLWIYFKYDLIFSFTITYICIDNIVYKYKRRIILFCYNLILGRRRVFVFMFLYVQSYCILIIFKKILSQRMHDMIQMLVANFSYYFVSAHLYVIDLSIGSYLCLVKFFTCFDLFSLLHYLFDELQKRGEVSG